MADASERYREAGEKTRKEIEDLLTKAGYRVTRVSLEGANLVLWIRVEMVDNVLRPN